MKTTCVFLLALVLLSGCVSEVKQSMTTTTAPTTTTTKATTTTTRTTIVTTTSAATTTTEVTTTTLKGFCSVDEDCPESFNSSTYCWLIGDSWSGSETTIYMDEVKYVCTGKGTKDSRCAEVRKRLIADTCKTSKCFNGGCYPTHCFNGRVDRNEEWIDCGGDCVDCSLKPDVACFNDCDCLSRESQVKGRYYRSCELRQITSSELVPVGRCDGRAIFQKLMTYNCVKAGTVDSYCTSDFVQQMQTASCRDKNCTLDCRFKTMTYPNLALINDVNVSFESIE